jgi:uncharacterized protein YbdZ (MbtH family)
MQVQIEGDNNCQFNALADQLQLLWPSKRTPSAQEIREACVDWIHAHADDLMEVSLNTDAVIDDQI